MLQTIELNHHSHRVFVAGEGSPPLVFIHGFPLDHTMWRFQLSHFALRRRVIAPDLRGFGGTPADRDVMSIEEFADDTALLLERLAVDKPAVICGLSMGGCIALQFVLRHRARVAGLILCDARAAADPPEMRQVRQNVAARALREGCEFLTATVRERLVSPVTAATQPELVSQLEEVVRRTSPAGVSGGAHALGQRADVTDRLAEIDVPALIIVGEQDVISPPAEMRSIADQMPQATYVEIAQAGHMAPLEVPDAVNAAIEHFLSGVPA